MTSAILFSSLVVLALVMALVGSVLTLLSTRSAAAKMKIISPYGVLAVVMALVALEDDRHITWLSLVFALIIVPVCVYAVYHGVNGILEFCKARKRKHNQNKGKKA